MNTTTRNAEQIKTEAAELLKRIEKAQTEYNIKTRYAARDENSAAYLRSAAERADATTAQQAAALLQADDAAKRANQYRSEARQAIEAEEAARHELNDLYRKAAADLVTAAEYMPAAPAHEIEAARGYGVPREARDDIQNRRAAELPAGVLPAALIPGDLHVPTTEGPYNAEARAQFEDLITSAYRQLSALDNITWTNHREELYQLCKGEEKRHRDNFKPAGVRLWLNADLCAKYFTCLRIAQYFTGTDIVPNLNDYISYQKSAYYAACLATRHREEIAEAWKDIDVRAILSHTYDQLVRTD